MSDSSIPRLPSSGEVFFITDELASSAEFLLHRSLASHLKSSQNARSVVVSVSGNFAKWKTVARKSNVDLAKLRDSGALTFVDPSRKLVSLQNPGTLQSLRAVYDELRDILEEDTLVLVDDLASLEWIGIPSGEVANFTRALCALCRKKQAPLILLHHILKPGELDDLTRLLLQLCTYRIDVFPLSSGRSGSVSGQVALHSGPGEIHPLYRPISRSKALLYRLTDSGCVFFERGTGAGVL